MTGHTNGKSWIAGHKSAFLIFGLFLGGIVLAIVGTLLEAYFRPSEAFDLRPLLGKVVIELSLALIVGGIAAVFLSLEEVVKLLSSTLAELFTQGEIAGLLSPTARETLMQKLVQERLGTGVKQIESGLYKDVIKLSDECLKSIHLRDFYVTTDFEPHPQNENFLSQQTTITFRVHIAHLRFEPHVSFPYRYSYRVTVPLEIADCLPDADFLLNFSLTVAGKEFTERQLTRQTKDGMCTIKFQFERIFDLITDETDVSLNYKAAALKDDTSSISRVRYPTRGFAKTIHYTDDFDYDCAWFGTIGQEIGADVRECKTERIPRGLTTRRFDWLLPGEGVALFWCPKQTKSICSAKTLVANKV
jgi:hypothetical protein